MPKSAQATHSKGVTYSLLGYPFVHVTISCDDCMQIEVKPRDGIICCSTDTQCSLVTRGMEYQRFLYSSA